MTNKPDVKKDAVKATQDYGSCAATHGECPNAWKGSCDREAGHDGSHHCSSCNSLF